MGKRFKTRLTEMFGIEHPVLCGGMQWVSRADFVSHVCNAGGMGFITAESFDTPEDLRADIRKMRTLTEKPFGVNISMVPEIGNVRERTLKLCQVVCEEGVKFVETAGRSPEPLMPMLKEAGIKVIHKLTSVKHAEAAERIGVDAVTLLGYGSGGHIGLDNVASFVSLPLAASRLKIPVIAGGAVANGRGFLGALAMGAEGVLMGTAFFASLESPVHPAIKNLVIRSRETDTDLIMSSIKNPMRCLRNKKTGEVMAAEAKGASLMEIVTLVSGQKGKIAYDGGEIDLSVVPGGQAAVFITGIRSVKEIINGIIDEAGDLLDRLNRMAS